MNILTLTYILLLISQYLSFSIIDKIENPTLENEVLPLISKKSKVYII